MEENKNEKLSYEQLSNVAANLQNQNEMLVRKLQELAATAVFKRLDYLFKIIENKRAFTDDFYEKAVSEIDSIMYPKEEQTNSDIEK